MMRRYLTDTLYNMRDLGGHPLTNNRYTAYGRIFRSDCPQVLSPQEEASIQALNITCVIDLRTEKERNRRPSHFANVDFVEYHGVSFINGNETPVSEEAIAETYFKMMEEGGAISNILRIISEAKGSVLYHCAVGKDRTGIVTALILGICGADKRDIIADYQVSDTYLHDLLEGYRQQKPDLPDWFGKSKAEYMRDCLALLEDKYGTFEGYMKTNGIPLLYKTNLENLLIRKEGLN